MSRLVTFGDTALRMTPPDDEPLETARTMDVHADGIESSVAVAASRLGTHAVWLSKLVDSPLGRRVIAQLHQHGLETDVVWADEGRQGLSFHETAATPRQEVVLEDCEGTAASTVTPGDLPMTLVTDADAVFVGGATLSLSRTVRETAEAVFRATDGASVLDLDFRPGLWSAEEAREAFEALFDAVDVLVATEGDARTICQRSGNPREVVHSIAAEHDFDCVVITRSELGAVAWRDNVIHETDAVETERVDPAGQHEAFVGGFLHRMLEDAPTDEALAWGTASAALTRTTPGPLPTLRRPDVERIVEDVEDPTRGH